MDRKLKLPKFSFEKEKNIKRVTLDLNVSMGCKTYSNIYVSSIIIVSSMPNINRQTIIGQNVMALTENLKLIHIMRRKTITQHKHCSNQQSPRSEFFSYIC